MFFLNLSAFEFFALLGTVGSVITALYLLDRRRRRRVVSTLQFWPSAVQAEQSRSRRHMQQPWSLLLQLLSVILLLLAAAQVQWGTRPAQARNHVVVLDTSAWAGARLSSGALVLDQEKRLAQAFLQTLPSVDQCFIVYADALASPAGNFTSDRSKWNAMLAGAKPGASSLNLEYSIEFARNAQRWSVGIPGEIVYIGPGIGGHGLTSPPENLRFVKTTAPHENVGFDFAIVQHVEKAAGEWRASFTLRNDGEKNQSVQLLTGFGGTNFSPRAYMLKPGGRVVADYDFTTNRAGSLQASIKNGGALESDDHVEVQLPGSSRLHVVAVTGRRNRLAPLLSAVDEFSVEYVDPAQYRADLRADLLVFDEFAPPSKAPPTPSLWLHPPRDGSPLTIGTVARNTLLSSWNTSLFGDAGLRTRDLRLAQAEVFQTSPDDTAIASVPEGPVVVARDPAKKTAAPGRFVVVGFDLLSDSPRTDLTTPLLIANALNWLAPQVFRPRELEAHKVGAVSLPMGSDAELESLRVTDDAGVSMPYSISNGSLQLFVERPRIVHVGSSADQRIISLTLPDVETAVWTPPATVRQGLPAFSRITPSALDLWKWLAIAGGLCLLVEWIFFGRKRRPTPKRSTRLPASGVSGDRRDTKVGERISA